MCEDVSKMTKKKQREWYKSHRQMNGFNTGTRDFKTDKMPSRARRKVLDKRDRNDVE